MDNIDPQTFAKDCINALLGLWAKPKQYVYSVKTASYTEDLQRTGPVMRRAVPGHPTLHDYIFESELLTLCSMRPIQQVTLDMEHVFLATAHRIARKLCEPRDISGFVTDAVICHPSAAQRKTRSSCNRSTTCRRDWHVQNQGRRVMSHNNHRATCDCKLQSKQQAPHV